MSSFLCFICHNAVNSDTTEETREKYREVVGMNLCPDSHLCYVCCHMVHKLCLFRSVCLKRSLEYPDLFSEKCTVNLQQTNLDILILCNEESCNTNTDTYYNYNNEDNDYIKLEDECNDYTQLEDDYEKQKYSVIEEPYSVQELQIPQISENVTEFDQNFVQNVNLEVNVEDECNEVRESNEDGNDDVDNDDSSHTGAVGDNEDVINEEGEESDNSKTPSKKKEEYKKILLSVEEQKTELEVQRKSYKYIDSQFKCYNCALGFLFKDSYQAHMMRHEESNGEFVCPICTLRFASAPVLRAHSAQHRERYACVCGEHVRKRQRDTHANKCHKRERDSATCHLCGKVYETANNLRQHVKRFHMNKTSSRSYPCNICGNTYNNQAAVRTHMIKHIQRKFSCDECPATFSSPYTLTQHKKKHSSIKKQFYCDTCPVVYSSKKSLLAHLRSALQHQDTVFECQICTRICPNANALSLHMARVHSSSKDYECNRCGHKYSCRKSLVRHMSTHAVQPKMKVAQCHQCGKSFKNNSKLNRHLKQVCGKDKLEEELAGYHEQSNIM
ncbi:uncharacterized protein LOC142985647 isoform X2 [Anticarsia gemmatalis]|uniref:uncharacterized protein LOC142985647 isoform X2 n=1 Tax=Anticarsia gemmatalis TaxID=129554 RepID=UPI003F75791A